MTDDARRYVPSLEAVVAAGCELETSTWRHPFGVDLLRHAPTECRPLAAVIVRAQVQHRRVSEADVEVPVARLKGLPEPIPEPPRDWSSREVDVILSQLEPARGCSFCSTQYRGFSLCWACGGADSAAEGGAKDTCLVCGGRGRVTCPTCAGAGVSVLVRMRTIRDGTSSLSYTYVPSLPLAIEERLGQLLERAEPPECLRFDMAPRRAGSAYRDTLEVDPVFEGHSFGDALARARAAVRGLGEDGEVLRRDVRAYAWPFLLLRWRQLGLDRTVALVIRPGDLAHLVVG